MKYKVGFIGAGNMGGALAQAAANAVGAQNIAICDPMQEKTDAFAALGMHVADSYETASQSEFLFLGVKPQVFAKTAATLAEPLRKNPDCIVVSMAAGVSLAAVRQALGVPVRVIRIMPNTPVSVGAGMLLVSAGDDVDDTAMAAFLQLMRCSGKLAQIPEALIDAGSAVSGCGPAFVYLFIEALADGGVACGLPRAQAIECAAQTVLGAAQMVLTTGKPCGQLKDAVLSPGGTTVQGVRALERAGFRSAGIEAVIAAYEKTLELKQ